MQTPQDLATSIEDMPSQSGSVNLSVNYTYSWQGGGNNMDDSRTWD